MGADTPTITPLDDFSQRGLSFGFIDGRNKEGDQCFLKYFSILVSPDFRNSKKLIPLYLQVCWMRDGYGARAAYSRVYDFCPIWMTNMLDNWLWYG